MKSRIIGILFMFALVSTLIACASNSHTQRAKALNATLKKADSTDNEFKQCQTSLPYIFPSYIYYDYGGTALELFR